MELEKIKISQEWKEVLREEFQKPYFTQIKAHYMEALKRGEMILPRGSLTFEALNRVKPQDLRVVILGQDPYHGGAEIGGKFIPQAMGLSFSVPRPLPPPPSLKNIYQELQRSLGVSTPSHGDLSKWCDQGVMLLNSVLSVKRGEAGSHAYFGWEHFSDAIISYISSELDFVVFMLWGNYAKKKASLIDGSKHCILTAPHPSPLAKGFVGSDVFLKANEALRQKYKRPIAWGEL